MSDKSEEDSGVEQDNFDIWVTEYANAEVVRADIETGRRAILRTGSGLIVAGRLLCDTRRDRFGDYGYLFRILRPRFSRWCFSPPIETTSAWSFVRIWNQISP